jgi:glycerol-3-phosphate dehydrogenase
MKRATTTDWWWNKTLNDINITQEQKKTNSQSEFNQNKQFLHQLKITKTESSDLKCDTTTSKHQLKQSIRTKTYNTSNQRFLSIKKGITSDKHNRILNVEKERVGIKP